MLTYSHSNYQQPAFASHYTSFMPSRPSPLAPRALNACPRPQFFDMSNRTPTRNDRVSIFEFNATTTNENQAQDGDLSFSKRNIKPNPLTQRRQIDGGRERRRGMFLRKVAENRDDKKWDARTDQILRSDYLAQQRAWEHERQRSDPNIPSDDLYQMAEQEQQLEDIPMFSLNDSYGADSDSRVPTFSRQYPIEEEADAIAQAEQEELNALIALNGDVNEIPHPPSEHYGSDDDSYNDLFMDFMVDTTAQLGTSNFSQSAQQSPEHDMDMDISGD